MNGHSVMTEASPDFEIEISAPPIIEIHPMNVVERKSVGVHDYVMRE